MPLSRTGLFACCLLLPFTQLWAQCRPFNLKSEHLVNPIGIDAALPRLSWQLEGCVGAGAYQKAYRIVVGTDSALVAKGTGATWTSGKVAGATMLVGIDKPVLRPFTRYYWTVQVWDGAGRTAPNVPVAFFETGMMTVHRWKGSWITDGTDPALKPAGYFRKEFTAPKKVKRARAYIATGGLHELFVNGRRVGNEKLNPMYTRFDRRTLYNTYDVTQLVQQGSNAIGVILGNGWMNHQSTAVWFFDKAPWRARPKFCMDLRIEYEDGSVATIGTGPDWKTATGSVVFNSIYTAEHHDARLEPAGWNRPGFADTAWKGVQMTGAPSPNIVAQQLQPIRDVETLQPVKMTRLDERTYVFDLGRNIAGVSALTLSGKAGTTIRLVHAERIYPNGHVDQRNIDYHYRPTDDQDPFQTDIFILSGKGRETFRPHFNYKGFQYVEVQSDQPIELEPASLTAYFMHSDVPVKGQIKSSSALLNKIWAATNSSYLSNLFGYPTDCPQREKNGWTGDAHIAIETGLYNFDGITVYEKWLADHRDEQQPNGVLPAIIPTAGWGYDWANGVDWTSTLCIIPWNIYLFYGDTQLLARSYEAMRRYVDHIDSRSPSGLTDWGLGDWIPIRSVANKELTSSLYFYTDALILSRAAGVLGKGEDQKKYRELADKIKKAVNNKFLDTTKGIYAQGLQTEMSMPLYWGIVPDEMRSLVARNLSEQVQRDGALDVGLLGSKAILNALSENGYADQAYQLASRDTFPSWGWWIKNGATTLYENWKIEGNADISLNHIMFGEIGAWYYKTLGGILPDPDRPGFAHVLLQPRFVRGLDSFQAAHEGPFGTIVSGWQREGNRIRYTAVVPPNSSASFSVTATAVDGRQPKPGKPAVVSRREGAGPQTYTLHLHPGKHELLITP